MTRVGWHLGSALLILAVGCAGPSGDRSGHLPVQARVCCKAGDTVARQQAVARTAASLVGVRTVEVNGRRIAYDCAGVTRAIYLRHGIDLYENTDESQQANGVRLIYQHVRRHGRIHHGPVVRPGDLVFFDNTWDYNGDGAVNDPLTHVGVVERVEADGTVLFISRVAGAVERYRMNLAYPHVHRTADGRILNDYLRRKKWRDQDGTPYLTGELFAAFGTRVGS
ncbi:hypothetical protein DNFV4_03562 [Nitrospira tepida]|uniref:NlpC/P60 domain-containing protein n=1 Tax=Nitrospira tepida TaxID=2973512 RepID=A0AA86N1V7_9BACT|nr:CHAP domain-containing protein [Nitrospira tepida]CAI4033129.1 hypothetical protein DNFV4_03562 [Nitrospira tepida]